jgi:hypothetical protein
MELTPEFHMAIYRLLREAAFDEVQTKCLSDAYEAAVSLLHLKGPDDVIAQLVAHRIIKIARTGLWDPRKLCAQAIRELGVPIADK